MATKFIQLEEAAEILGISPEKLLQMREQNEIRGFRDGSNWKFKAEELDRVKATLGADELELDLDETGTTEGGSGAGDSILLSEKELGSGSVGSSTVIGQSGTGATDHSDLKLPEDEFNR
ncbi:MAG: helix-turn-helix domain-containing protein, partial [Pirellulales bacterium]